MILLLLLCLGLMSLSKSFQTYMYHGGQFFHYTVLEQAYQCLSVYFQNNFYKNICLNRGSDDPKDVVYLGPRGMVGKIYAGGH